MSGGYRKMYQGKRRLPIASRPEEDCATPYDKSRVYFADIARTRALSGPVKTWTDMTPEERAEVLKALKGRKP